jgi:hypothetical protein
MSATFTDLVTGEPVQADGQEVTASLPQAPKSELRSVTWRTLRHCAAPPAVVAALACGAAIGSAGTQAALVTTGTYLVVAALLWLKADGFGQKRRERRAKGRRVLRRTYRIIVSASGLVWLTWASFGPLADGSDGWRYNTALMVFGVAALTALRSLWFGSKIPNPVAPVERAPEAPPAEVALTGAAKAERDWAEYVAYEGSALYGATFTARDIEGGVQAVVRLVRGRQTEKTLTSNLDLIRSGLDWSRITVTDDDFDTCLFGLTMTQRTKHSAAAKVREIPWEGPRVDEQGRIDLGPYQDQQGVAYNHLLGPNGVLSTFVGGDPRTGKSNLLENVAVSGAAAGLLVPSVLAHSPSAASVDFSNWAWKSAKSLDGVDDLLTGFEALLEFLLAENDYMGWSGWDPSQGRPAYGLFCPEFQRLSEDKVRAERFERLVREGPKAGMMCAFDSQDTTLRAFRSLNALRNACGQNFFCTYTADGEAKSSLRLAGDPTTLPVGLNQAGWAYGGVHARREPFRGRRILPEVYQHVALPEVPAGAANAFNGAIPGFDAREAARTQWRHAMVAARNAGEPVPLPPDEETLPPLHPDLAVREQQKAAVKGEPVDLPNRGGTLLAFRAPAPMARAARPPARTLVLRELAVCPLVPGELVKRTGLSDTAVRDACAELVGSGLLAERASKFQPWELTDAGRTEAAKAVAS